MFKKFFRTTIKKLGITILTVLLAFGIKDLPYCGPSNFFFGEPEYPPDETNKRD